MALFDFLKGGMTGSSAPHITPGQLGDQPVGDLMTPGDAHYQPGLLSNLNPQTVGQAGDMLRDPQEQQSDPQAPSLGGSLSLAQSGQQQRMMALVQQLLGGR